jgi:hypothetical protein
MEVDKSKPTIMGVFRAIPRETPFFTKKSERKPDNKTPTKAAKNGAEAKNPDFKKSNPRYSTRYVGNHVKKNHNVEFTAN